MLGFHGNQVAELVERLLMPYIFARSLYLVVLEGRCISSSLSAISAIDLPKDR